MKTDTRLLLAAVTAALLASSGPLSADAPKPEAKAEPKTAPAPAPAPSGSPSAAADAPKAADQPAPPPALPITDDTLNALSPDEVRTLMRIVNLPQEKLESLRQSIDVLAKMTPEEKQRLRKKLELLRNSPPGNPPPGFRRNNPVLRYWRSLPPEKFREEQAKFNKMTREERRAYIDEIIKKAPRPHPPRQRPHPPPPPPPHEFAPPPLPEPPPPPP
jgi:hypothetical protein